MTEARLRWTVRLGAAVIRALASTWRFRVTNETYIAEQHAQGNRLIYTLWHGELLPLLWLHRHEGVAVVISEHRDGEIVARIAETLGYETIRGSTSRGGSRALIGLMRALDNGRDVAVTPDGPRGPAHVFAPGAAIAAQRTGASILPTRASASRAWRLKSWDRFLVPKPFARVDVVYGTPTTVEASSPREAAEHAPRLQGLLETLGGS
jgi:lysophospholipid acyltransferase (LPLAT)-like uncharacterized protein